jgi:hypothetical protein
VYEHISLKYASFLSVRCYLAIAGGIYAKRFQFFTFWGDLKKNQTEVDRFWQKKIFTFGKSFKNVSFFDPMHLNFAKSVIMTKKISQNLLGVSKKQDLMLISTSRMTVK